MGLKAVTVFVIVKVILECSYGRSSPENTPSSVATLERCRCRSKILQWETGHHKERKNVAAHLDLKPNIQIMIITVCVNLGGMQRKKTINGKSLEAVAQEKTAQNYSWNVRMTNVQNRSLQRVVVAEMNLV